MLAGSVWFSSVRDSSSGDDRLKLERYSFHLCFGRSILEHSILQINSQLAARSLDEMVQLRCVGEREELVGLRKDGQMEEWHTVCRQERRKSKTQITCLSSDVI
jgi:hypothetical protein